MYSLTACLIDGIAVAGHQAMPETRITRNKRQAHEKNRKSLEACARLVILCSVRTAHQEQRGTADRNNCRAVADNPLVNKVKKTLSSALTINIYFNPCRKEKLYIGHSPKMWRNPMSATAATCIQLVSPGLTGAICYIRRNPYYLPGLC